MRVAGSAQSHDTMARMSFRIRMRMAWASSHSISTRCVSRRRNSGVRHASARSTSICGSAILKPGEREASLRFESLLRDKSGEATFAEPWQAQAFALVVHLHRKGAFTWQEWASALADEINRAAMRGEADDGTHYYDHWLAAL